MLAISPLGENQRQTRAHCVLETQADRIVGFCSPISKIVSCNDNLLSQPLKGQFFC